MKYQLIDSNDFDANMKEIIEKYQQRVQTTPPGVCPVAVQLSLLQAEKDCLSSRSSCSRYSMEKELLKRLKSSGALLSS